MSELHDQLSLQLDKLEQLLRAAGWWSLQAPEPQRLASVAPFCVDTLGFEEWLQWIFLPRMRQILQQRGRVPAALLGPMAEQSFGTSADAAGVVVTLQVIDRLLADLQTHRSA